MVDISLRDMILAAMSERTSWAKTHVQLLRRGHNEIEVNDVLEDLVFRGLIEAHELPDDVDEEMTWYEPKRLTRKGYEFIDNSKLDLKKLISLLVPIGMSAAGV